MGTRIPRFDAQTRTVAYTSTPLKLHRLQPL